MVYEFPLHIHKRIVARLARLFVIIISYIIHSIVPTYDLIFFSFCFCSVFFSALLVVLFYCQIPLKQRGKNSSVRFFFLSFSFFFVYHLIFFCRLLLLLYFVIQFCYFIAMLNVTFYLPLCDKISAYGSDLCGSVDEICNINAIVCSGIGFHDDNLIEKLVATQYFFRCCDGAAVVAYYCYTARMLSVCRLSVSTRQ